MLKTTSSLITFYTSMERGIAEFYTDISKKEAFQEHHELLQTLAKENLKHVKMVKRAYQEGVTDAYEVGFIEGEMDETDYALTTMITENDTKINLIERAILLEETSGRFCEEASKGTSMLLASLPYIFQRIAKRKEARKSKLQAIQLT